MSIINRLKSELESFETEAKDEIYRFLDFLRLRHQEEPLPDLNTVVQDEAEKAPEASQLTDPVPASIAGLVNDEPQAETTPPAAPV